MKILWSICLLFSLLLPVTGKKDKENEMTLRIKTSLRTGNAKELSAFFGQNVELLIDSEKVDFSKISNAQAEQILRTFFKKKPPRNFQFVYQGTASSIKYSTGMYQSSAESYLVYILMKRASNSQYMIETLQFRKDINPKTAQL
jgi:Domain of unknown function (DUF4783)